MFDVWAPHELTIKNIIDQIFVWESVLNCNKINPRLNRLVADDEKEMIKPVVVESKCADTNCLKPRIAGQEDFFMCLVGLRKTYPP